MPLRLSGVHCMVKRLCCAQGFWQNPLCLQAFTLPKVLCTPLNEQILNTIGMVHHTVMRSINERDKCCRTGFCDN